MEEPEAEEPEEEFGLSLEELGQTYAQMLGQGAVPYQQPADAVDQEQRRRWLSLTRWLKS